MGYKRGQIWLRSKLLVVTAVLVLSGLLVGCSLLAVGDPGSIASPTPMGDTLSLLAPAYTYRMEPGDMIPGARLEYVRREGDAYAVRIDGLDAIKRTGDSFIWNGVIAPGVYANYNLRLTTALFGALPVAGPVELIVFDPVPQATDLPTNTASFLYYNNVVLNYNVPVGREIPGTTLYFEGTSLLGEGNQASQVAQLSGIGTYPYRAMGDTLIWTGTIRPNVYARYSMRVIGITEEYLRVAGTADIWLDSQLP